MICPLSAMKRAAWSATDLATLFLLIGPLVFWEKAATFSFKIVYKDWVAKKVGVDRDGNPKKIRHFVNVMPNDEGAAEQVGGGGTGRC